MSTIMDHPSRTSKNTKYSINYNIIMLKPGKRNGEVMFDKKDITKTYTKLSILQNSRNWIKTSHYKENDNYNTFS